MSFKDYFSKAVQFFYTPSSGSKRHRDDANDDHERKPQAARVAQTNVTVVDEVKSLLDVTQRAGLPALNQSHEILAVDAIVPAGSANNAFNFGMAGRVRELTRARSQGPRVNSNPTQVSMYGTQDHNQHTLRQFENASVAQPGPSLPAAVGQPAAAPLGAQVGTAVSGLWRPLQPSSHLNQPGQQPQPSFDPGSSLGARAAVPLVTQPGPQDTPDVRPPFAWAHAQPSHRLATPRQLFSTPNSALQHLDNLHIASSTPVHRGPVTVTATAGGAPSWLSAGANGSMLPYYGTHDASAAATAAATISRAGASGPGGNSLQAPRPHISLVYPVQAVASARPQALPTRPISSLASHQRSQLQRPHPQQPRQAFPQVLRTSTLDLTARNVRNYVTEQQLKAMVQVYEDRKAQMAAVTPRLEDGGYIAGDDEEEESKTTSLARDARATVDLMRSTAAAAVQKISDPRVVSAAANSHAARSALGANRSAGCADTLMSLQLQAAAFEQAVKEMRANSEVETMRKVTAMKAEQDARQAQQKLQQQQMQQRFRQVSIPPLRPASAAGPSIAAKAAEVVLFAPTARAAQLAPPLTERASSGRASAWAAQKARLPPQADDVLDLVSSDEEEEETVEEVDIEEVEDESEEDDGDPYAVEYGAFPGEERGGGNPALRTASRSERSTWRRIMDPHSDPAEVVVEFKPNPVCQVELARCKLQCMELGTWLNDEVINLYMLLLQMQDTRLRQAARTAAGRSSAPSPAAPRCHFFNSFFYNKLFQDEGKYNYSNVRRWTVPKQLSNKLQESPVILELDRIIMPIHKGVHWTCAEVDLKAQTVRYYDSLGGEDRSLARHLLEWVADESADKLKHRWDMSKWSVEFPKNIPQQKNGCDCGVFSIMFADRRGVGRPFDFSQRDMPLLRIRVLHRIMQMRVDV